MLVKEAEENWENPKTLPAECSEKQKLPRIGADREEKPHH